MNLFELPIVTAGNLKSQLLLYKTLPSASYRWCCSEQEPIKQICDILPKLAATMQASVQRKSPDGMGHTVRSTLPTAYTNTGF